MTDSLEKPRVKYDVTKGVVDMGNHVYLYPVNHPREYLNGNGCYTSVVVKWHDTGVIETLNTIYEPHDPRENQS